MYIIFKTSTYTHWLFYQKVDIASTGLDPLAFRPRHRFNKVLETWLRDFAMDALLDWDLVTVEAIWVQWTHCHIQETSLRLYKLYDMLVYSAGNRWAHCGHKRMYIDRAKILSQAVVLKWCSVGTMGCKCTEKISPTPLHQPTSWTVEIRPDGSTLSCCLQQILTLPWYATAGMETHQTSNFLPVFYRPLLVRLNYILRFQLSLINSLCVQTVFCLWLFQIL